MDSGGRSEDTLNFVDVCVSNPFAPSNAAGFLSACCYKKHETQRREHIDKRLAHEAAYFINILLISEDEYLFFFVALNYSVCLWSSLLDSTPY